MGGSIPKSFGSSYLSDDERRKREQMRRQQEQATSFANSTTTKAPYGSSSTPAGQQPQNNFVATQPQAANDPWSQSGALEKQRQQQQQETERLQKQVLQNSQQSQQAAAEEIPEFKTTREAVGYFYDKQHPYGGMTKMTGPLGDISYYDENLNKPKEPQPAPTMGFARTSATQPMGFASRKLTTAEDTDYSKYGNDFSKEYIDEIRNDKRFRDAINKYIAPNEGGYVNNPKDPGGETNYGISKRQYPSENIADLTPERAEALYHRDYWNYNGINKLPDDIVGIVVDNAVNQGGPQAIRNLHRALNIEPGDIIGAKTLQRLSEEDIKEVRNRFADQVDNVNLKSADENEDLLEFLRGLRNRANRYRY